jgi:glycosyltransferase involved in cell wall biosynthesis
VGSPDLGEKFVSGLIDTYNHERFIEQAIVSVLEQDFPESEREIIVVDDGSADRTPKIVKKFEPRVRLLRKKMAGKRQRSMPAFQNAREKSSRSWTATTGGLEGAKKRSTPLHPIVSG